MKKTCRSNIWSNSAIENDAALDIETDKVKFQHKCPVKLVKELWKMHMKCRTQFVSNVQAASCKLMCQLKWLGHFVPRLNPYWPRDYPSIASKIPHGAKEVDRIPSDSNINLTHGHGHFLLFKQANTLQSRHFRLSLRFFSGEQFFLMTHRGLVSTCHPDLSVFFFLAKSTDFLPWTHRIQPGPWRKFSGGHCITEQRWEIGEGGHAAEGFFFCQMWLGDWLEHLWGERGI